MITMCMDMHVLPKLVSASIVSTSFDLWMSKGVVNTFALVINYLIKTWEPMHIVIEFFEVNEMIGLCINMTIAVIV
jgi:hypothetical protein